MDVQEERQMQFSVVFKKKVVFHEGRLKEQEKLYKELK